MATGLVLVLALTASACTKKNGSSGAPTTHAASAQTPPFDFSLGKVVGVPAGLKTKGLDAKAKPIAGDIATFMANVYKAQFLDPANWQNSDYSSAWAMYDSQAVSDAKAAEDVLTLGSQAGGAFSSVKPAPESQNLPVKVLLDDKGNSLQAVAIVTFTAKAAGQDGGTTTIVSKGQYFLKPAGSGWQIFAFSVTRDDTGPGAAGGSATSSSTGASP
jgi:hypothetical protein